MDRTSKWKERLLVQLKWYLENGVEIPRSHVYDQAFEELNQATYLITPAGGGYRELCEDLADQQFLPLIKELRTLASAVAGDAEAVNKAMEMLKKLKETKKL